jgi:hypothetical protein
MKTLLIAIAIVFVASAAHAQGYFGGNDGGMGRYHGYVPQPGYRAINHDPRTGRTYAREADILAPKPRVLKRKTQR